MNPGLSESKWRQALPAEFAAAAADKCIDGYGLSVLAELFDRTRIRFDQAVKPFTES